MTPNLATARPQLILTASRLAIALPLALILACCIDATFDIVGSVCEARHFESCTDEHGSPLAGQPRLVILVCVVAYGAQLAYLYCFRTHFVQSLNRAVLYEQGGQLDDTHEEVTAKDMEVVGMQATNEDAAGQEAVMETKDERILRWLQDVVHEAYNDIDRSWSFEECDGDSMYPARQ